MALIFRIILPKVVVVAEIVLFSWATRAVDPNTHKLRQRAVRAAENNIVPVHSESRAF